MLAAKYLKNFYLFLLNNFIWVLVVFFFLYGAISIPKFTSFQNITNLLYQSSATSMMILGMALCLLSGHFDLSLESTFAFGPAIGILFVTIWFPNTNYIIGIIIALAVGAVVGFFNGILVVKLKINSFLATLAMLIVLRGIVNFFTTQGIYTLKPGWLILGSGRFPGTIISYSIPVTMGLFLIFNYIINNTAFGKNIIATGSNSKAAYLAGINVDRIWILVFTIAGVISSFGGLIGVGRMRAFLNTMGEGEILLVFAGTVLGGISLAGGEGKIINALGGSFLLIIIATLLNLSGISPFLIKTFQGIILLIAILLGNLKNVLYRLAIRGQTML